jgi:hypothetical protein
MELGFLGSSSKTALIQFQKENNLPIGNLDYKTIDKLGVKY